VATACVGQSVPPNLPAAPQFEVESCGWAAEPEAVQCFRAALDEGGGAEIFIETVTMEGDPIYQIVRAVPGGSIEIYTDASQDTNAGAKYYVEVCETEGFSIGPNTEDFNIGAVLLATPHCEPTTTGW
jgi:hypothetical protein